MKHPLIINARGQMAWYQRFCSDASTLALWSMWLWLCRPALVALTGFAGMLLGIGHPAKHSLYPGALLSLEDAVFALLLTGGLLMLWNRISSQPAPRPRTHVVPDYAMHFGLDGRDVDRARASAVCVVHHDEHGRIVRIDAQAAAPVAAVVTQQIVHAA